MEDIFRAEYTPVSDINKERIKNLKKTANKLLLSFNILEDGRGADRETSIAITKLEEAVMWAVKSFTSKDNQ